MPEKKTLKRARKDAREGKSKSTQAGEFVREEIHHIRAGKHGARSTKQAIAIGLSKARRSGVALEPGGSASAGTKKRARRDEAVGQGRRARRATPKRRRASKKALERQGRSAASTRSLSRQGKQAARRRTHAERSRAAKRAARTRQRAAKKK